MIGTTGGIGGAASSGVGAVAKGRVEAVGAACWGIDVIGC